MGQLIINVIEGGQFAASFPDAMSSESIVEVSDIVNLQLRALLRGAKKREGLIKAAGDAEYESWFAIQPAKGER